MKKRKNELVKNGKTWILMLDHHDPKREFEFDLAWQMSLTTQQRFEMMIKRSNDVKEMLIRHGHRKPVEIVKRTSRPKDREDLKVLLEIKKMRAKKRK